MKAEKSVDTAIQSTMTKIGKLFKEMGGRVNRLAVEQSGTRGYMFQTANGSLCVVSIPKELDRSIITVANPQLSKGVDVPAYDGKERVSSYLTRNIPIALEVLTPIQGSAEHQLITTLRG